MMSPSRKTKRCLTLLMALVLITGLIVPSWAVEPILQAGETSLASQQVVLRPQDKISPEVQSLLDHNEPVEAIVYLNQTFDVEQFKAQSGKRLASLASPYEQKLAQRRELVVELQDFSHKTQHNLLQLLKNNHAVEEYESYHIANVVYVKALPEVIEAIAQLPEVRQISPNQVIYNEVPVASETVQPSQQDDLLWHLEMVKANQVWALGIDGTGVVVGVMDSGVDGSHPSLERAWRGYSEDGNHAWEASWLDTVAGTTFPVDSDSHGTHVTGTIVGRNPETGFTTGVAPGAKWIAARVFDPRGATTSQRLLEAAQWMLAPGGNPDNAPDIVNNSWGGGNQADDWYLESVRNWLAAGILPVFSAGNQRSGEPLPGRGSISNPSHYEESYAVGAIDQNMLRGSFSKRGPSPYTSNWKPDISAPGVGVISSIPGGGFASNTGTSMAAPHVSGVAALVRSANASITPEEMVRLFSETAYPLTDSDPHAQESPNHDYGYGLINAYDAVVEVAGGSGTFIGKVVRQGSDSGKPVIEHTPSRQLIYQGSSLLIEADIHDDVSVVSAQVIVEPGNHKIPLVQIEGDHTGGTYQAVIEPDQMQAEDITYQIQATDYVANLAQSDVIPVKVLFGIVPGDYLEGFEDQAEGWNMNGSWAIGRPEHDEELPAFEGEQVAGTNIGGLYGPSEGSILVSPPIDMRHTDQASLRFYHWHQFGRYDTGTVYVTNDELTEVQEMVTFTGRSNQWNGAVVDLSAYANRPTPIRVVFRLASNATDHYLGWYIDAVRIVGQDTEAPAAPSQLNALSGVDGIRLDWQASLDPDVTQYEVYRSTQAGSDYQALGRTTELNYLDPLANLADDTTYYYIVKAIDLAGNLSPASNEVSAQKRALNTLVQYDFEDNDGGFSRGALSGTANDWEWGDVVAGHGPENAHSGSKVWATGLTADYSSNAHYYLEVPAQLIPAEGTSYLKFAHWFSMETGLTGSKYDFGKVKISRDGTVWDDVTPDANKYIGGNSQGWQEETIDLSAYAGDTIRVRFEFKSDFSGGMAGWFIDDVQFNQLVPDSSDQSDSVQHESATWQTTLLGEAVTLDISQFHPELSASISPQAVPALNATVSVVETGFTVRTDPRTAEYRMRHKVSEPGQTWTLKAEAYGFKPSYFESELLAEHTVEHTFVLEPQDVGSITGQVVDRYDHRPVAGASVQIMEDPNIEPVITDDNGNFSFPRVYVGDYTLHASQPEFISGTMAVTVEANQASHVSFPLERFVGLPGEIIYDDGSADNAMVVGGVGAGVACLFTPPKYGKLRSAAFNFWNSSWPVPGGNEIGFGVFVRQGMKIVQIGETIVRDDIVRGEWITIDFSHLNFSTDQDFFIGTVQTKDALQSPAVGIDNHGPVERAFIYANGTMANFVSQGRSGLPMIRAHMSYSADRPEITNLDEINYVNRPTIALEGEVHHEDLPVRIYRNDELVETIPAQEIEDGIFRTDIELPEEVNHLKASLVVEGAETEPGAVKTVILDQVNPRLEIASPRDESHVNVELVHLKGSVSDKYFEKLLLNGQPIAVSPEGEFSEKVIVTPGENVLSLAAFDKAGNLTQQDRTVYVDLGDDLALSDMLPAQNITLSAGDSLEVAFSAAPGGQASYMIIQPFTTSSQTGLEMVEGPAGRYTATWIAPADIQLDGAEVYFQYSDAYGNRLEAMAPGKISLMLESDEPLMERIAGANRYETALAMSQKTFSQADTVVIASGENFPDALVGGPYAERLQAPVLLTPGDELAPGILAEVKRLGATQAIVLGGEQAVAGTVMDQLDRAGLSVRRLSGATRFETAAAISQLARSQASRHVFLVGGYNFPDALSIAPVAARQDDAILLTGRDRLPQATLDALAEWKTEQITLVGGNLVISQPVEQQLSDLGYQVKRVKGESLYQTNIKIARSYFNDVTAVVGASGQDYPDALVGSVYAALHNAPIILLGNDALDAATIDYLTDMTPQEVVLLGGTKVISPAIEQAILDLIR